MLRHVAWSKWQRSDLACSVMESPNPLLPEWLQSSLCWALPLACLQTSVAGQQQHKQLSIEH